MAVVERMVVERVAVDGVYSSAWRGGGTVLKYSVGAETLHVMKSRMTSPTKGVARTEQLTVSIHMHGNT